MAAPLNKSARKLSAFFSHKQPKDDHPLPPTPPQQPTLPPPYSPLPLQHPVQPSHARGVSEGLAIRSHRTSKLIKSSSIPNLASLGGGPEPPLTALPQPINPAVNTSVLSPLVPPPALANYGPPRPASSQGSVGSRPDSRPASRVESREGSRSRPSTPNNMGPPFVNGSPSAKVGKDPKALKRLSWMPKKAGPEVEATEHKAWIAGLKEHVPYDSTVIFRCAKIPDVWNEGGDVFVYLFPRKSGKGPSFKIASNLLSNSKILMHMSRANRRASQETNRLSMDSRAMEAANRRLSVQDGEGFLSPHGSARGRSNSSTGSAESIHFRHDFPEDDNEPRHLYLPLELEVDVCNPQFKLTSNDMELLVLYRNFFAFLTGGALIATPRQSSLFAVFVGIGTILAKFEFANLDGSTFGEVVSSSFARYCDELRLADVRASREKTIEAIVLGEKMRSWSLYNEGFVHGAGKLAQIKSLNSLKYNQISAVTGNRLERASIDLDGRIRMVETKLADFDFPSMFAGIANSQMAVEAKMVRFKAWKLSFQAMRKQTIAHYRQMYGSWPPKAKSKKNNFEESGLNRLLLQNVYQDFTDLYDMLVDRTELSNHNAADINTAPTDNFEFNNTAESFNHALRRIESEYNSSTAPVLPTIPFDTPLYPSLSTSFNRAHADPIKDVKERSRRLRDNEVNELLLGSYNRESMKATPFLEDFLRFERGRGRGQTMDEIVDQRCGQWLFLYAVLQSVPMVVVDARDVRFSEGVEYFLCVPPRGGRPWMKEDTSQSRSWYNVASGGGLVSMPADTIDHSVEGIYRRSHCWQVAAKWAAASEVLSPATQVSLGASLPPPPVLGNGSRASTLLGYAPSTVSSSSGFYPSAAGLAPPGGTRTSTPSDSGSVTGGGGGGGGERRSSRRFSFGLEELPLPPGVNPDGRPASGIVGPGGRAAKTASVMDPSKTFDAILDGMQASKDGGDKKKGKVKG